MTIRGRFAPSPSGRMHLGNIFSAMLSWLSVRSKGGEWILRIEDLDAQRCRREYADMLEDDLRWLGLTWDEGGSDGGCYSPYYQSERSEIYLDALRRLQAQGLLYPCYCRRADILSSRAPHETDGAVVYSGMCRQLNETQRVACEAERKPACRIIVPDETLAFTDGHCGLQRFHLQKECGDFVVRRADGGFAYQLAVVVDDALMGITEVVRGNDLLSSTPLQIYLQQRLGYATPQYFHLPMLMSTDGRRLAKRNGGTDMEWIRSNYTPQQTIGLLAFYAGIIDRNESVDVRDIVDIFDWNKVPTTNVVVDMSF